MIDIDVHLEVFALPRWSAMLLDEGFELAPHSHLCCRSSLTLPGSGSLLAMRLLAMLLLRFPVLRVFRYLHRYGQEREEHLLELWREAFQLEDSANECLLLLRVFRH